jgi:hypothetical protein
MEKFSSIIFACISLDPITDRTASDFALAKDNILLLSLQFHWSASEDICQLGACHTLVLAADSSNISYRNASMSFQFKNLEIELFLTKLDVGLVGGGKRSSLTFKDVVDYDNNKYFTPPKSVGGDYYRYVSSVKT